MSGANVAIITMAVLLLAATRPLGTMTETERAELVAALPVELVEAWPYRVLLEQVQSQF